MTFPLDFLYVIVYIYRDKQTKQETENEIYTHWLYIRRMDDRMLSSRECEMTDYTSLTPHFIRNYQSVEVPYLPMETLIKSQIGGQMNLTILLDQNTIDLANAQSRADRLAALGLEINTIGQYVLHILDAVDRLDNLNDPTVPHIKDVIREELKKLIDQIA